MTVFEQEFDIFMEIESLMNLMGHDVLAPFNFYERGANITMRKKKAKKNYIKRNEKRNNKHHFYFYEIIEV